MSAAKLCTVCKVPIVVPHCESKNCTWCRACPETRVQQSKK